VLSFDDALAQVLAALPSPPVREVQVSQASGLVLAQDIVADADMPAFDRTAMDGFALRSADAARPGARLRRVGEIRTGGEISGGALAAGECVAIYTGAPIPAGADAVVMVERTRTVGDVVELAVAVARGENIRFRGEDVKKGELLLSAGCVLRPQELAVCASFGAPRVRVHPRPRAAILSTGDELVSPDEEPGPGQIRDSNGVMLEAQAARAGASLVSREVVRDEPEAIEAAIEGAAARADLLVLTGGVSMGAYDLVAPILGKLGFAGGFHKVRMKPGKPVWFGRRGAVLAFGLPGNPVSSFVTFELMVRPAIRRLLGLEPGPRFETAAVAGGPVKVGDREQFLPARVESGKLVFIPWTSSADFVELARANALARVPVDASPRVGDPIPYLAI
jgi:molybdenum cofactor synthesis domain-containing protein